MVDHSVHHLELEVVQHALMLTFLGGHHRQHGPLLKRWKNVSIDIVYSMNHYVWHLLCFRRNPIQIKLVLLARKKTNLFFFLPSFQSIALARSNLHSSHSAVVCSIFHFLAEANDC